MTRATDKYRKKSKTTENKVPLEVREGSDDKGGMRWWGILCWG